MGRIESIVVSEGTPVLSESSLKTFVEEIISSLRGLDLVELDGLVRMLAELRDSGGRLFLLGVGGSAGHASHAANDFRKLCNLETYCVTDNVSELTARINDEGWDTAMLEYLRTSKFSSKDAVLVFSVGGGNPEAGVSTIIVEAVRYASEVGAKIGGIVGRDGGFTKRVGSNVVVIPTANQALVTPVVEGIAAVVWHAVVSDSRLAQNPTKW